MLEKVQKSDRNFRDEGGSSTRGWGGEGREREESGEKIGKEKMDWSVNVGVLNFFSICGVWLRLLLKLDMDPTYLRGRAGSSAIHTPKFRVLCMLCPLSRAYQSHRAALLCVLGAKNPDILFGWNLDSSACVIDTPFSFSSP